jgi:hypothetical protein
MLFSTVFNFLLATVPLIITASPTPFPKDTKDVTVPQLIFEGIHLWNGTEPEAGESAINPLAKRDDNSCGLPWGLNQVFYKPDSNGLSNALKTNNPNTAHSLPHNHVISWTWGNAKICVINKYILEDTYVSEWEAGWSIGYILGQCSCGTWW